MGARPGGTLQGGAWPGERIRCCYYLTIATLNSIFPQEVKGIYNVKMLKYRGFTEFRVYQRPVTRGSPENGKETPERGCGGSRSEAESLRRSKETVRRYAFANEWEWFCTLTFNPEKVDSYNYQECVNKLSVWLNNARRKEPDMRYLWVPELHKSGRFHFHGLMSNISSLRLLESGKRDKTGRPIYNIGKYRLGWSTATRVSNNQAVAGYLLKYLTKEMCAVTFNRRRYWVSKNCELPEEVESHLDYYELKDLQEALSAKATWAKVAFIETQDYRNKIYYYSIPE